MRLDLSGGFGKLRYHEHEERPYSIFWFNHRGQLAPSRLAVRGLDV